MLLVRDLWSRKSSELYNMLSTLVSAKENVEFSSLHYLKKGAPVGLVNTFSVSLTTPNRLEKMFSAWSYFNRCFILDKVRTHIRTTEVSCVGPLRHSRLVHSLII